MALEAGQLLSAREVWSREAVSAGKAAPQRGRRTEVVTAIALRLPNASGPGQRCASQRVPSTAVGLLPARPLSGSPGARNS